MKKIIVTICSIILSVSSINVALAYEVYQYGDFTVRIENDTAEISKYTGYELQPIIPSYVNIYGDIYPVTKIGSFAFKDNSSIEVISIPFTVKTIENSAFKGCVNLWGVSFSGNSLQTIEYSAFEDCISLDLIFLPDSLRTIQTSAFSGCISLRYITLSNNLTSIPTGCFSDCMSLSHIELPDGVKKIDSGAFRACISLTEITIPSSVISINWSAFSDCSEDLTIYGVPGSFAEEYAVKNDIQFSCSHQNKAIDVAVAPTCTETGLTEGSHCSVCKTVLKEQETIPALGHTEVEDKALAPTCTEPGFTEGSHCNVCGKVLVAQMMITAIGHNEGIWTTIIEASLEAEGLKEKRCTVCSVVLDTQIIPKLGEEEDERISGDVNEDGVVDGRDLLRLAKFLGGFDVEIIAENATVNGDNFIDGRDLLRLAKYLGGYVVSLE